MFRKSDKQDRLDIQLLVQQFYGKVRKDELLASIFNKVIRGDWKPKREKMSEFWSSILLFSRKYFGDPMPKHLPLPINNHHFECWLYHFHEMVRECVRGDVVEVAKNSIENIVKLMHNMKVARMTP